MKILPCNTNFQGRRDNVDAVINLDDRSVQGLAYGKTMSEHNFKKDRRISNLLIYSAPIAAGIAHTLFSDAAETKIFSKTVKGFAARCAGGLKVGAYWASALLALDLMGKAFRGLRKSSETYRNFDDSHSFAPILLKVGSAFGVLSILDKVTDCLGETKAPQFMQNIATGTERFLNNNKRLNSLKSFVSGNVAVLPETFKSAGKLVVGAAPWALILSGMINGVRAGYRVNNEYNKNYVELKEAQSQLAKARIRELSMQNDFLMQDKQNQEDIALLNNPTQGLDEEVLEKIDELHAEA